MTRVIRRSGRRSSVSQRLDITKRPVDLILGVKGRGERQSTPYAGTRFVSLPPSVHVTCTEGNSWPFTGISLPRVGRSSGIKESTDLTPTLSISKAPVTPGLHGRSFVTYYLTDLYSSDLGFVCLTVSSGPDGWRSEKLTLFEDRKGEEPWFLLKSSTFITKGFFQLKRSRLVTVPFC